MGGWWWGGVQYDVEYTVHTHNGRGRSGDCLWVFTLYVRYVCMYLCMYVCMVGRGGWVGIWMIVYVTLRYGVEVLGFL